MTVVQKKILLLSSAKKITLLPPMDPKCERITLLLPMADVQKKQDIPPTHGFPV